MHVALLSAPSLQLPSFTHADACVNVDDAGSEDAPRRCPAPDLPSEHPRVSPACARASRVEGGHGRRSRFLLVVGRETVRVADQRHPSCTRTRQLNRPACNPASPTTPSLFVAAWQACVSSAVAATGGCCVCVCVCVCVWSWLVHAGVAVVSWCGVCTQVLRCGCGTLCRQLRQEGGCCCISTPPPECTRQQSNALRVPSRQQP